MLNKRVAAILTLGVGQHKRQLSNVLYRRMMMQDLKLRLDENRSQQQAA